MAMKGTIFFGDRGDAFDAANENQARDDGQADSHDLGVDAPGRVKCVTDGVGLHHVAHEPQGQNNGDGEKNRQSLGKKVIPKSFGDVIGRPAGDQGGHRAHQVARADLGGDGGGQGLEGTHAFLARGRSEEGEIPKKALKTLAELENMHSLQFKREEEPRAAKQKDQAILSPQK
jgi:hypothetical protein